MSLSYEQPMRESLKAAMDAINSDIPEQLNTVASALQENITAEYKRANQVENNLTTLYGQLSSTVSSLKSIVDTIPDFEYGYSNSVTIPSANTVSVDITFSKEFKETPQVFTEVMCNTLINILVSHVTYVDTTKCTIKLYNGGTTDVQNVTVDYLALAGR